MRYRRFLKSGVTTSEVGFGLWTLSTGWWGNVTDQDAIRLLQRAYDFGIIFYDTADTYGNGRGETLLAKAFRDRRNQITISTKFGYDFYHYAGERKGQQEIPQDFSPQYIRFACEESLKRLETDHIDFYQVHNSKMDAVMNDELFETLEGLKSDGKILGYGAALGPAIGWRDEGIKVMQTRKIDGLHMIYNMLEQEPGCDFFPVAEERQVGILVRVPHSSGMLEGVYTPDTQFDEKDHRSHRPRSWLVEGLQKVERLKFLTQDTGRTISQAALKFILAQPSVVTTLPNIYNENQLREFASAVDTPDLTKAEIEQIEALYKCNFYVKSAEEVEKSS
ncbi:MAG: aldo/keto reductase [Candidatus Omnitrophica bacterium]|nr:aldo/keto reductase [Candidatus Omnitrophota bacterium]